MKSGWLALIYDNSAVIQSYKNLPVGLERFSISIHVIPTISLVNVLKAFISSVGIDLAIVISSILTNYRHCLHGPSNYLIIFVHNNSKAVSDKNIPLPRPLEFLINVLTSSVFNI